MERHISNALKTVDFLENHPLVEKVNHPHLAHLANVADVKSLVIHPASTTHSQMTTEELLESGIKPATIRLSIGIEHIDDIIADLEQALDAVK